MKPTQITETDGSINQIPGLLCVRGDIRLTPFYDWKEVRRIMQDYAKNLEEELRSKPQDNILFPSVLPDAMVALEFKWLTDDPFVGIACDMDSPGFKRLSASTVKIMGQMKIQSCCGSLPLVAELQSLGFDLHIMGYGIGKVYHACDEYCLYSDMEIGYRIIVDMLGLGS